MQRGMLECFLVSLKLGLTSFGGPVAHLGYFRETYVERGKWVSEKRFAELLALTQFLPGPASSQLGAAIGYERAGWLGGLAAWLGFTLPSAIVMIVFAAGMGSIQDWFGVGWLHGLKLAAIAVVAVALLGMRKGLCPRWPEMILAVVALIVLRVMPELWMQPLVILMGALLGAMVFHKEEAKSKAKESITKPEAEGGSRPIRGLVITGLLMLAMIVIPMIFQGGRDAQATGGLFRAGALVFGGGHVVLPLLESSTVDTGMVSKDTFLAGYGAAQAVPGPLFTFGGFLGASMGLFGNAWVGGTIGIVAIFLPGMIVLAGGLPVWNRLKEFAWARAGVRGANATVVGLLAAALLGMLTSANVGGLLDGVGIFLLALTIYFKWLPVWLLVLVAAVLGGLLV
jgi:chromate transporter